MAALDLERDTIVIRVVYDGPPYAGKTTSVRALARSLSRAVETPGEAAGRTLFFDWMEYTGGLFDGRQIRCQIVTVPGQRRLAARRRALLASADVVVLVADTASHEALELSAAYAHEAVALLAASTAAPVGVVVQANKREVPGALPRDEVRRGLGASLGHAALTESDAASGIGIRETFVLAVRLALDRVRALTARGELPRGRPGVDSADALLAMLEGLPTRVAPPAAAPSVEPARLAAPPRPRAPDTRVPTGAIWPPVEGRVVLHEATIGAPEVVPDGRGDWVAGVGGDWWVHSAADAEFHEFNEGRGALLAWARVHATRAPLLSRPRCVVLADTGHGSWRLWQLVRRAPSLRGWLLDGLAAPGPELLRRLCAAAALLAEASLRCADTELVPSLDSVGPGPQGPQFVALMPAGSSRAASSEPDLPGYVARELSAALVVDLPDRRRELAALAAPGATLGTSWEALVARILAAA